MKKKQPWARLGRVAVAASAVFLPGIAHAGSPTHSVARQWNEQLLAAIRVDYARPTVHARNLYHVSVAMWDAWSVYDDEALGVFTTEKIVLSQPAVLAAREEAISFAAYRVLKARFAESPGAAESLPAFDALMDTLGYNKDYRGTLGNSPAAVGNRCAIAVLFNGLNHGANEGGGYENQYYEPVNAPLLPDFPGNPDIIDPNRWQPLALEWFLDQGGNPIPGGYPEFLSPEWGQVTPFSLKVEDRTIYTRGGFDYWVYHDPGPPPEINGVNDEYYRWGFEQVAMWSGHLDPTDGVLWDISPASIGNAPLPLPSEYETFFDRPNGGDWGTGYTVNPATGLPYTPQLVPRGGYARILAEFGPTDRSPKHPPATGS